MLRDRLLVLGMLIAVVTSAHGGDTLEQYAQKCDQAIGITVPDFNCDSGTLVPTTHFANNHCDRPNVLNSECDPGSRFQVLPTSNADAYAVAHCRKRGHALGDGLYKDIAVIQHNRTNGATCFYQALGSNLNGDVKAPSKGTSTWPWLTPAGTANEKCGACHDNGPIIRSPYLSQVVDSNRNKLLPGAGDSSFNHDQPYYFVGTDFASWKTYKVEVAGNMCNGCHRMGVNNVLPGHGTARDFGIQATAASQTNKNPHSADSPMWMLPGQTNYNQSHADAAQAIKNCADQFNENSPLPNSPNCKIIQFNGVGAPTVPGRFTSVWRPGNQPEIQVYGWNYADYRNKYDQLWPMGWRLYSLEPYVINGQVLHNAVWRQSTEGEIQVYGWTYTDYRKQYDQLWPQGWRLKLLQPYVVNGQVRYTAVWRPSTEGEIQVYGWSYAAYRKKYDELWPQGWRLKLLQPYVVNGQVLYTAVWRPSTEGEIQVYGWSYADYRKKYDELWPQGWRLKLLQPYVVNGQVRYTAVWRPSTEGEIQVYGWSYADYRKKYDELWPQGWRLQILQAY